MSFYANSNMASLGAESEADTAPTRGTALAGDAPQAQQRPFYGNSQHDDVKPAGEKASAMQQNDAAVRVPDEVAKLRAENRRMHDPLGAYRSVLSPGTLSAALPAEVGECAFRPWRTVDPVMADTVGA